MRVLGRIAALVLGVPLAASAAFGLVRLHAADSEVADRVEIQIIQTVSDRARSQQIVGAMASQPGAYGAAGFALLLLFFAVKPVGRGDRQDDAEGAGGGIAPQPDARMRKKTRKLAASLARKGEHLEAAEMLLACDELEHAAEYFIDADELSRAAEVRHDQNRFLESAALYVEAGDCGSAATIFAQEGEFQRAAECYLKADAKSTAAEMFEKAGDFRRAGDCYRDVEFLRHAAQCYVKCKRWFVAAECLEQVFNEEKLKGGAQDPQKHAEMTQLVRRAAKLFLRAEEPMRALRALESGRCYPDAASLAMKLGEFARAAEFYKDANDLEHAAEALHKFGETAEAERLIGEHCRSQGNLEGAARHLEAAEDYNAAGDLYRQIEMYGAAAACYVKQGEHRHAAEMYRMGDERVAAADAYERAGCYKEAAECCALAGLGEREAALLERAGDLLSAGHAYHREGLDDSAISVLQRVEGEGVAVASALLADIFRSRGQLTLAIKMLMQAIGVAELDRESLPMFYTLATLHEENNCPSEALEIYEKVMGINYHYEDVEQRAVRLREQVGSALVSPLTTSSSSVSMIAANSQPGRYEIVGELGRGGMGIVYKAQDTALDRVVAYKVLPDTLKENPQAMKNFFREARAAAKLNHPNIVTVYDTGEQEGCCYIAMEFVDGTTLKEILRRRGPISPRGVLHVMMQLCEALAYAHEKKVVHRDIKTANAMWTRDKKAKIMDFGLAKVVEEVRNHTTVVSGTPYYMSPEQTLGKNVDHRTDIYSLGVTSFELLTGSLPFSEGNIPYHHVHTPAPNVRTVRVDVPAPLAAIVERCMAKEPGDRFQSAGEVLEAVRSLLSS